MNTPVSFEIAKLLKEHGYNESCYHYYYNNKLESSSKDNWNDLNGYSAPTISEVVMWLYEKHGVWIIVEIDVWGNKSSSFRITGGSDSYGLPYDYDSECTYTTPTEAYSAAIEYTLKNLI